MKKFIVIILGLIIASVSFAKGSSGGHVHVNGYTRRDGTYVQPHYRTAPDSIKTNNWSYVGNVNPYTGRVGTKTDSSPNYGHGGVYYSGNSVVTTQQQVLPPHYVGKSEDLHNTKTTADYSF